MPYPGTAVPPAPDRRQWMVAFVSLLCLSVQPAALAELPPPVEMTTSTDWAILHRDGVNALEAGQYYMAEPLLAQALYQAEKFGPKDLRLAKTLGELGRLYAIRGKIADAEHFYERELEVKEKALGSDDSQVVAVAGKLIKFYLDRGTASKADRLTETVLGFVEGKLRKEEAGTQSSQVRAKGEAGAPLEAHVGVAVPHMKGDILEWAYTCDSIGTAYRLHEKYSLAERFYRAALDLKETILPNGHLSLAISYDYLGMVYAERKQYHDAEFWFKDALLTTEKTLPADSKEVYTRLDRYAKCMMNAGKNAEAAELYTRSLKFWEKNPCTSDQECRGLYSLGLLYIRDKKYAEAAPVLQKALSLAENYYGPVQITLVPYLQQYAYALYYLDRMPEVLQLRARADAISGAAEVAATAVDTHPNLPLTHTNEHAGAFTNTSQ